MSVLVVCTGNTCRSPMAEQVLRSWGVEASSAGTDVAMPGEPMAGHALAALAQRGIDGSGHRARRLTLDLVRGAAEVLVMSAAHRDAVLSLVPDATVALLDVPDPYGGTLAEYAACLADLERALARHR